MTALEIVPVPVLSDNYVWLIHDSRSGVAAAVDPAVAEPVLAALHDRDWTLDTILITHHHHDHVGGVAALKKATGATVVGAAGDAHRLPPLDHAVRDGEAVSVGQARARVMLTPGHTAGHAVYWFADDHVAFTGDTLFSMGCGRLFEGTPARMWESLSRLRQLPEETWIYCAHEYTAKNGRFAQAVMGDSPALKARLAQVADRRARHQPTLPVDLGTEKATNPFLRADDPALAQAVGLAGADAVQVFAALRDKRNGF